MKRCRREGCEKMVYFEPASGKIHDFCCRSHALGSLGSLAGQGTMVAAQAPPCSTAGCMRPRFRDPVTGVLKDYCGKTHALMARGLMDTPADADNRNGDKKIHRRAELKIDLTGSADQQPIISDNVFLKVSI